MVECTVTPGQGWVFNPWTMDAPQWVVLSKGDWGFRTQVACLEIEKSQLWERFNIVTIANPPSEATQKLLLGIKGKIESVEAMLVNLACCSHDPVCQLG